MLSTAANLAGALIGVAMAVVVLGSPNTASIINAGGSAFIGGLRAAMGH